ncbi:DODA-type extradiol aromatic ring-opening family dioxygenase [Paenibacillus brevis]|uniref:Dioxygenase n=1 Tax=Paenibacillus brevis TaxID=2841508 RepID=A0ABS6FLJ4_9BACL|nr:class III extradiol ring-cleavage dioxygenase [Paenibacillus brevis]MBU5671048.1 dioxygenase [Paenibacillus brevis]
MTQPALFIAHGAPTLAIENNAYTAFLRRLGQEILSRPKAIVLFSAHWDSPIQFVTSDQVHDTIHDFYGFPDELYEINYPAPGSSELTAKIEALFKDGNLAYKSIAGRGLDHGAWIVLREMFPACDVPVVALSVDARRTPAEQYAIGKMLMALRDENVLVIGSGGLVHNLRMLERSGDSPSSWAVDFDKWIEEQLANWDLRQLFEYDKRAPHAREAVPSYAPEHFAPLLYAMGASDNDRSASKLHQEYEFGNLSLNCWMFGSKS